ncbi:hypothetical protein [Phocicoccus pinnipedialis]|uniref:Lipoprotein n=1 Tax=Phocicoccus pinnipedialis TaxID=110845 RepID=A0A6V7R407_9BACL|nr:hypothetical protein [Jeotgalicoccus pinnipedialis]MBP1939972.1 hypothetical protein [Jeotgalicoccus pinnipedialis]CAD2072080.1 hypothetical protein JEOPIN946_00278 [Jeotgalicoccus pinnipedialis]
MNVIRLLFVSMLTLSILVACSQKDTKETVKEDTSQEDKTQDNAVTNKSAEEDDANKNNVEENSKEDKALTAIKEQSKLIESYRAQMDMTANLDNSEEESLELDVNYINGDKPAFELKTFDTLRMVSVDGKTVFNNSEEWVDISDSVELNALFHVTYDQAVQYFSDIYNELERVTDDGEVKYVYEGNDGFVYNRLERYLQVSFGTVDTTNHHTEIEFTVDEKNNLITDVEFSSEINDQEGGIELDGEVHYNEFDEIKEIILPEM